MVEVLTLHLLLIGLPMIKVIKVGDNNRHWKGDGKYAGNGAKRSHYFTPHSDRPVSRQN